MDSLATSARLEWWANRLTCLAAFDVSVTILVEGQRWQATGQLVRPEERNDLASFCDLDGAFDLRLPDESTVAVMVSDLTPGGSLVLTELQ
jgi:hypothetical protein